MRVVPEKKQPLVMFTQGDELAGFPLNGYFMDAPRGEWDTEEKAFLTRRLRYGYELDQNLKRVHWDIYEYFRFMAEDRLWVQKGLDKYVLYARFKGGIGKMIVAYYRQYEWTYRGFSDKNIMELIAQRKTSTQDWAGIPNDVTMELLERVEALVEHAQAQELLNARKRMEGFFLQSNLMEIKNG